ncbi:MAG: SpoIID/LytB domain-containing protein [Clostridia bacterium]|nr:SpoIID/LytB domain-containing protein [Clostridia bacterium]
MKRILFSIMLLAVLFIAAPSFSLYASEPAQTVKIGLKYGNDALPAAKFKNKTGTGEGYEIGYFDSDREFKALFTTNETDIAVLKNKQMWVTASEEYYDTKPSSYRFSIGCYHLQASSPYEDLTSVSDAAAAAVAAGYRAYPAYIAGRYYLRVGEFLSEELAANKLSEAASATGLSLSVTGLSRTCYTFTKTGTDVILFQFDLGGDPAGVSPLSRETWFNKFVYYGGFELNRINGNDITVVNVLSIDDYIKGVIPYEISPSWPVEAQKAQALCAKCYVCNNINKHRSQGFDLCNTTDCQVYYGTGAATNVSDSAVESVKGLYITYGGKICNTFYHSSSGGWTEDVENIWGNYVPYLRAVEDKYLDHVNNYSFDVTLNDISAVLQAKGYTNQNVTDYYVSRRSPAGNVIEISFTQADGTKLSFTGDRARTAINSSARGISVQSHRYNVSAVIGIYLNKTLQTKRVSELYVIGKNGEPEAVSGSYGDLYGITSRGLSKISPLSLSYNVTGTGSGHNIGLCQWGAYSMGNLGFTYEDIVKFYFTGVEITNLAN